MHDRPSKQAPARRTKRAQPSKGIPLLLALFGVLLLAAVLLTPEPQAATTVVQADGTIGKAVPSLHITEVMSSNKTAYPDENGNFGDWLELTNEGTAPLHLDGYGVSDREDKIIFTFPTGVVLEPGGHVVIFADDSAQSVSGKTYHAKFKISSAGEELFLFGPEGTVIEKLTVPMMTGDLSYAKVFDGWITTDMFSPGFDNTQEGHNAFKSSTFLEADILMLNEMVASNRTTLIDEDDESSDWIEIYNNSDKTIDLSKYALSDNPDKRTKWRFPEGAVIGPHEYYLVFASGKDRPGGEGLHPHTNFNLSADKETVILSDFHGQMIDQTSYEVLPADQSWGRKEGSDRSWQVFTNPTPGMPNTRASSMIMNDRLIAANPSGIAITEVMSSNVATTLPNGATGADWIELFNYGRESVDLSGYGLSDSINFPRKWRFPQTVLQPGQYLLVYCDGTNTVDKSGGMHTNYRVSSAGETIVLCDPAGKILDKLVVPQLLPDLTYGRTPGQGGLFYYAQPTPGAANSVGFDGFAEVPSFVTRGGMYPRPLLVEFKVPEGAQVRYTLDATEPNESSPIYTAPFEVPSTTVVRARSYQAGLSPSPVITQTFFISVYHSLPVVSLVTDPDNVWNHDTGMLADGNLDRETWARPWYRKTGDREDFATFGKKLHYDGFIELYMKDGSQALSSGMDFHVMGQYSLDMPQKSFSVNAKKRFGTGWFEYPLFPDRPFERYKAIALRNGGQDGLYTRVLDGLQARVAAQMPDTTVLTQAWRPVIVYLNGKYWGHYNMRERVNRYFVAQHEGWDDPDAMDILESSGTSSSQITWGSNSEYKKLIEYVEGHDLKDPEAMQYVADRVDIDNMFDYFIYEMYIGNTDPGNIRFYKKRGEGNKWKWILYDMDWGLFDSKSGGPGYVLNPKGMGAQRINNKLIRAVLENPEMRDKFLRRMGVLFQDIFTPENILPMFDEMLAEIQDEMPMHNSRWADEMPKQVSFDVPKNPEGAYSYWQIRVERARNVINKRPNIFWGMVQEHFELSESQMLDYFGPRPDLPAEE